VLASEYAATKSQVDRIRRLDDPVKIDAMLQKLNA
jgi:hypothetical protein